MQITLPFWVALRVLAGGGAEEVSSPLSRKHFRHIRGELTVGLLPGDMNSDLNKGDSRAVLNVTC